MSTIHMELGKNSYPITVKRGGLASAGEYFSLERKVLIVTDEGIPAAYPIKMKAASGSPILAAIREGETSKSFAVLETLLGRMLDAGFGRGDAVVAVGGGVVGDIAGFAAATYMRGIDFYNMPTTLLAAVDASIGGKAAVNLGGVKNVAGTFYQPKAVLIDPDLLETLPKRQVINGLAEAAKMAACFDETGFRRYFEEADPFTRIDEIIEMSLCIKKAVVERDEKEQGERKLLNFGHTIGHGIESVCGMEADPDAGLYHGECVAVGMLPMCGEQAKKRLLPVLEKIGLPTKAAADADAVMAAIEHDKKAGNGYITTARLARIGAPRLEKTELAELRTLVKEALL